MGGANPQHPPWRGGPLPLIYRRLREGALAAPGILLAARGLGRSWAASFVAGRKDEKRPDRLHVCSPFLGILELLCHSQLLTKSGACGRTRTRNSGSEAQGYIQFYYAGRNGWHSHGISEESAGTLGWPGDGHRALRRPVAGVCPRFGGAGGG